MGGYHSRKYSKSIYKKYNSPDPTVRLDNLPEFVKLKEVAGLLRISVLTLKRMCKRGEIKYIRINSRGDRRFRKQDVLDYMNSLTNEYETTDA